MRSVLFWSMVSTGWYNTLDRIKASMEMLIRMNATPNAVCPSSPKTRWISTGKLLPLSNKNMLCKIKGISSFTG
jgi:hypothetical protein